MAVGLVDSLGGAPGAPRAPGALKDGRTIRAFLEGLRGPKGKGRANLRVVRRCEFPLCERGVVLIARKTGVWNQGREDR